MDVNMSQAQFLLTNFSKEAVAGQVNLSVAEKATIGVMNSYKMKVQDVTKVQDIMFNLVKYGVGTYADFANVIGLVTPSAVRANQTFQQTAALMAFTTRNGLSASEAASAVARGMDAIGKSRDSIQKYGQIVTGALGDATAAKLGITANSMLKMTDASGKLLPINQIMTELGSSLKNLNPTQLNDVLVAMFKGTGGTIQAMRFITLAVKNYGQLNNMVKQMGASKGALQAAYNIMANTPAMKIQLMKNNFQALMITVGNDLLPVLGAAAKVFANLFSIITKIPAPILKIATIFGVVASVGLVIAGVIVALTGAWLVFSTILAASEVAILPLIGTVLAIVAVVALLAVAAYEIYSHWGAISSFFVSLWNTVKKYTIQYWNDIVGALGDAWNTVVNFFEPGLKGFVDFWVSAWTTVLNFITGVWNGIIGVFKDVENWVASNFDKWWLTHGESVKEIWNSIWGAASSQFKEFWSIVSGIATAYWSILTAEFKIGWEIISTVFKVYANIIIGLFKVMWTMLSTVAKIAWDALTLIFKIAWDVIALVFEAAWNVIVTAFKVFWAIFTAVGKIAFATITLMWKIVWDTLVVIFNLFLDLITGHWHTAWMDILNYAHQIGNALYAWGATFWHALQSAWEAIWNALKAGWIAIWHDLYNTFHTIGNQLYSFGVSVWNNIKNAWSNIWHSIYSTSMAVWGDVKGGVSRIWADIVQGAKNTVGGLKSVWGGIESAFKGPVNFVIRYAYDDGLRAIWNGTMNAIGLGKLNLPAVKTLATGGKLGGFGGGDRNLALLEDGEAVIDKHRTRKYAPLLKAMGVPGFAGGGLVNISKMVLAATTGNETAFANDLINTLVTSSGAKGELGNMISTFPKALARKMVSGAWSAIGSQAVKSAAGAIGLSGIANSSALAALKSAAAKKGWVGGQWTALNSVEMAEAGYNIHAQNPTSGAYGLAQFINGAGEYAQYGGNSTTAAGQAVAMVNYIAQRYGNPVNAWNHETAFHWYKNGFSGDVTKPTIFGAGEAGREHVEITPAGKKTGPTQNFYITTQEINPRYHAAQLGFELARRSS
jgi:TP901 family phage tail tape measure protein